VRNQHHSCLERPSVSAEEKDDEGGMPSSPTEESGPEQHCNEPYYDYVETLAPVDSPKKDLAGWHHRGCRRNGRRRKDMFIRELLKDDLMGLTEMINLTTKALVVADDDMHAVDDDDGIGSALFLDDNDSDLSPDCSDEDSNDEDEWSGDDEWNNDDDDDDVDEIKPPTTTTRLKEWQERMSLHHHKSIMASELW
jgi:hypothetical protein